MSHLFFHFTTLALSLVDCERQFPALFFLKYRLNDEALTLWGPKHLCSQCEMAHEYSEFIVLALQICPAMYPLGF